MSSLFPSLIAGLGLFFVGMYFLTEHLKAMNVRRLRKRIALWTRHPALGLLWGGIFMTITQSTSASTFILVGMIRSGMMQVKQALPVVVGANMLAGLIIFVFAFDIKTVVFIVLGIAGISYTSDRLAGLRRFSGSILGVCLLFLGLNMMQSGAAPLADDSYINSLLEMGHQAWLYGFLAGCFLTVLLQTSIAVVVMTIAFLQAGLFTLDDSMMIVYGANVGASLLTMVLSSKLVGASRQVAMFQTTYNFVGAFILVPMFLIEYYGNIPMVKYLVLYLTDNPASQLALINLLFNFFPGVVLLFMLGPTSRVFEKVWPETAEEQASKPKFLHDQAIDDPSGAFDLIELEQIRLLKQLSSMFGILRNFQSNGSGQLEPTKEAFNTLCTSIREAISELSLRHRLPPEGYEYLDYLLHVQHALETASEEIMGLAHSMESLQKTTYGSSFASAAIEGLDTILMMLIEVARGRSEEDAALLEIITAEDGSGVSRVRSAYLGQQNDLDSSARLQLLSAANHCERFVWLMGGLGRHYMENRV